MNSPIEPPLEVRGMTEWKPDLFNTSALIPSISVNNNQIGTVRKTMEKYLLKMNNLKPVQECDKFKDRRNLLLNPSMVSSFRDLESVKDSLNTSDVTSDHFRIKSYQLSADNWTPHELLRSILPMDEEGVSGFSTIGHIVHLNLRQHLEEYKSVIGQILLRLPSIRTVVNKSSTIDNTYRNFSMEVLAGEEDFIVSVKESGCSFNFDFSKVYWNPRLATEHDRVIKMMNKSSILYDACAGVGPFSVPSAKICKVLSNDLNPESYKWLLENISNNKKSTKNIQCFNRDAREFIKNEVKNSLKEIWTTNCDDIDNAHIVMNLPALAITFVDVFHGLFSDCQDFSEKDLILPNIHVYCFSSSENPSVDVRKECEGYLGQEIDDDHFLGVNFVRNVSPNKDMFRIDFKASKSILFATNIATNGCDKRPSSPVGEDMSSKRKC